MLKNFDFGKFKILDGSMLKIIAIITMFIDHCGLILFSRLDFATEPFLTLGSKEISIYFLMRKIGRLAFPIFCFLITEGFIHTRNKKRYGFTLLIFAIISEIPYNLMVSGKIFYLGGQNIYLTLFLGFFCLYLIEKIKEQPILFFCLFLTEFASVILHTDYGIRGVSLILLLYILRNSKAVKTVLAFPLLSGGIYAFAAFLPINMYNGKRGFIKGSVLKYFFYIFYPLHIVLLLVIRGIVI